MKKFYRILECILVSLLLLVAIGLYIKFAAYVNKTNNYMIKKEQEIIEKQVETYKEQVRNLFTR